MSPNISCLIYDMDGLLLDTEGIYTEVTQQIVGEYGKVFDWSVKEKIIGRRSIQAAEIIVESLDLPISPQDYLDSRKDVLLEKFKDTEALPGAKEMTTHFFQIGDSTSHWPLVHRLRCLRQNLKNIKNGFRNSLKLSEEMTLN